MVFKGKYLWFCFLFFSFFNVVSQEIRTVSIQWKNSLEYVYNDKKVRIPQFEGMILDMKRPFFLYQERLKNPNYTITITNFKFDKASNDDEIFFQSLNQSIADTLTYKASIECASKDYFAMVNVLPFALINHELMRLVSFDLILSHKNSIIKNYEKDFVATSVLASGEWYKIKLKNDGVYKIDKSFLTALGINVASLNPQHIHIFGNGEGRLPENNSVFRSDDLKNNAIYIEGESDGVFNDADYILFHGWGPDRKYPNSTNTAWVSDKNIYSDYSYYFIHINAGISPNRIQVDNSVVSPSNLSITKGDFHTVFEQDVYTLVKGGQRWYGDLFDTELYKTYSFVIPDLDLTNPVKLSVSLASDAFVSNGSTQQFYLNNQLFATESIPSAGGEWMRSSFNYTLNNNLISNNTIALGIKINRTSPSIKTHLDRIEINAKRGLAYFGNQFYITDFSTVGPGNVGNFQINTNSSVNIIWDVTHRQNPKLMSGVLTNNVYSFNANLDSLRCFIAFNGLSYYSPEIVGKIKNQNLHALPQADLLIVSPDGFISQANRLADLHRSEGLIVNVATLNEIYNEFSSGALDPTAIRMFAKMFYDRANLNGSLKPSSLLLFGDGTYDPKDRIQGNNNYVPTYQVLNSEHHIFAMVSDDYFGMLDDSDAFDDNDLLDIGIGRLLISSLEMAKKQVDKIEHYMKNGSNLFDTPSNSPLSNASKQVTFGDWRLNMVQIADDEEGGGFITQDVEPQCSIVKQKDYALNIDKLYLDAYNQETQAGGQRYPQVYDAISDRINNGCLLINYVGHGGEVGVAEERVITIPQILEWNNIHKMNLFVSATCEFTKFDDPSRVSAGEWVSLNEKGGAIAVMTTTRSIYISVNTIIGKNLFETVYNRDASNKPLSFGEIIRLTKNGVGGVDNKRVFTLIGDPALRIALPQMKILTDSINGLSPSLVIDTLKALSKVKIKGHIEDWNGNVLNGFNGYLQPSIYDKPKEYQTLGQDPNSPILSFELQKNKLFTGNVSVTNGRFEFEFIVPKDINYNFGKGKISYYGFDANMDAYGADSNVYIGGLSSNVITDDKGPDIQLTFNSANFVTTGLTDESPTLIAELFDENGINTVGNGIGHDLSIVIDKNSANPINVNNYFKSDLNTYQSGKVNYQLLNLAEGEHTLTLTAWDVNNNSSSQTIQFRVDKEKDLAIDHVLNYPNPFTTNTSFYFEHNQVGDVLDVQIDIMTITGKIVKTIQTSIQTSGYRTDAIPWDGRDEYGDKLGKGVYVYKLKVKTKDGKRIEKIEKLVLL